MTQYVRSLVGLKGANSTVSKTAVQSDGKVIVTGSFTLWGSVSANRIARINTDGNLDTEFQTNIGTGPNNSITSIVINADGTIIVGGSFLTWNGATVNRIVKLNPNGTRDTTFTDNIGAGPNNSITSLAINNDGSIIVAGGFTTWNSISSNYIVKLSSVGVRDTTFTTNVGTAGLLINNVSTHTDGTIIAGGTFTTWNGVTVNRIVKLSSAGVRDTTFTTNTGTAFNDNINSMARNTDGSIIAVGSFTTFNGTTVNYIVKLSAAGVRDTTFTTNTGTGANSTTLSVAIGTGGTIIVGGLFSTWNSVSNVNRIVKLSATGVRDTTFTTNIGTGFNNGVENLTIDSSGRIICSGSFTSFNQDLVSFVARLSSSGIIDKTIFFFNVTFGANAQINTVTVQSDGKILIGGDFTIWNEKNVRYIIRLNADGTLDTEFVKNIGTGPNASVIDIAVNTDGTIIVVGFFTTWNGITVNRIVKLDSSGRRDTTFQTNVSSAANNLIRTIAIQSNGQILLGGDFTTWAGTTVNRIVRLNSVGTRDTAFTTNAGTAAGGSVYDIKLNTDGSIIVVGIFSTWAGVAVGRIVKLSSAGVRDTAFTTNTGTGANTRLYSVAINSDGTIVAGGDVNSWNGTAVGGVVKLSSAGVIDTTFNANVGAGASSSVWDIKINTDGTIIVGGAFSSWNFVAVGRIVKLSSTGVRDTTFTTNNNGGGNATVFKTFINTDGTILVGGGFTTWGAGFSNRLVLLNSNGTTNTNIPTRYTSATMPYVKVAGVWKPVKSVWNKVSGTWRSSFLQGGVDDLSFFQGQTGPNNFVYVVRVQPDGKLLVGGNFTTWNGVTANGFVRLNADASIDTAFMANVGTGGAGAGPSVQDIILNSDGSMVLGGTFLTWNGATSNYIVKLNSNGTRDTTFGTNIGTAANSTVWSLAPTGDGGFVAGGTFSTWNGTAVGRIVKLSAAGVRDTTFTTNNAGGANGSIRALAIDYANSIIAGGLFTTWGTTPVTVNYIVKLGATGSRAAAFTTNVGTTQNNNVYAISVNPSDGGYIIGGDFTIWGGVSVGRIVRLSSIGVRNTTFTTNNGTGFDGTVWTALQIDSSGRIMIGGFFTAFGGVSTPYIARLSSTGVREAMFTTNISGINIGVQGITLDNNGMAYIGGRFTTINGRTYNKFARIGAEATA